MSFGTECSIIGILLLLLVKDGLLFLRERRGGKVNDKDADMVAYRVIDMLTKEVHGDRDDLNGKK